MGWADAEALVVEALAARFAPGALDFKTGKRKPTNLVDLVTRRPLLMVYRFGGGDDHGVRDEANCDIDVYANTEAAAKDFIGRAFTALVDLRNFIGAGGHVITGTRPMSGPAERPFDSRNIVYRYGFARRILLRPSAAS